MADAAHGESSESSEIEYKGALGHIRARGRDPLIIISLGAYVVLGLMVWDHSSKTETVIRQMVREMRLSTCISATPETQREAQYANPASFCNRMAQ